MSNIDLHSHVIPPTVIDVMLRDRSASASRETTEDRSSATAGSISSASKLLEMERELYDVDAKIAAMDRMRIDISALSVAPPTYFYELAPEAGLAASRLSNDGIAQMVAKYPARLRGMATLPMQDPDAAITELERVVKEHKFKAVEIGTSIEGEQLAHPHFRPVLKTIEQLGCFVFAHPYACAAKGGMDGYELFNTVGYPLDETIMVAHLMAAARSTT